jgi:hypothetical protein
MSQLPPVVACPNCGATIPHGSNYCASCGYGAPAPPARKNLNVLWLVLFVIVGIPAGCLGGCFMLIAGGPANIPNWQPLLVGLAGVGVFVLLLTLLVRSNVRKP